MNDTSWVSMFSPNMLESVRGVGENGSNVGKEGLNEGSDEM